jgi:putative RNA 2'-phosphotransferase
VAELSDPLVSLSRVVSHALRHEPWLYELELDEAGWVPVPELLQALRELGPAWARVDRDDLVRMVASSSKRRHEIDGDRIRALYGHSVPARILKVEAAPPEILFHGTSPKAWESIRWQGLAPMGRQYVHLSVDVATAVAVGRRKSGTPVVLRVHAREACEQCIRFWRGNEMVWLADVVPAEFLDVELD